ncbi:MAG: hypothetical protein ACJ8EY_04830 [Sphingomicrobium sp.]
MKLKYLVKMMKQKTKKLRSNETPLKTIRRDRLIHLPPQNAVAYAAALEVLG